MAEQDSLRSRLGQMFTYPYTRSGFTHESATSEKQMRPNDLIKFLAVAQKFAIDFLPITWQPALDHLGHGATAEIREASANLQFSFAFKRPHFQLDLGLKYFETFLLPSLIAEISALALPSIREHPNIVNLEGICWEVMSWEGEQISREAGCTSWKGGIIPVLVFEKSNHGDLHQFMMGQQGRNLSFRQKIGICTDIAKALAVMGLQEIVHGDLKPQNVLIFDNEEGGYVARVTDFGYSTQWTLPNELIQMPRSRPWNAPEWHHRGFTPAQAMKMDSYSFGMVVLWLLGYAAREDSMLTFETDLHTMSETADLAHSIANSISQCHGLDLHQFFNVTLALNEQQRCSDFYQLQSLLTALRSATDGMVSLQLNGMRITISEDGYYLPYVQERAHPETANFQVISSMYQFFLADIRVRIHIASALLSKTISLEKGQDVNFELENLYYQCAMCYEIGFGVARDQNKAQGFLKKCSEYDHINFASELEHVENEFYHWYQGADARTKTRFRSLFLARTGNHAPKHSLLRTYLEQGVIDNIERQYRNEILDIQSNLGVKHGFVVNLKNELKDILTHRRKQKEANDIDTQVRQNRLTLLPFDPSQRIDVGASLEPLLLWSRQAGRTERAELLCREILASRSERWGDDHIATTDALSTLSEMIVWQDRWQEAEGLLESLVDKTVRTLGQSHPDTFSATERLIDALGKQKKWDAVNILVSRLKETFSKVYRQDDPVSLVSRTQLARLSVLESLEQQQQPTHQSHWRRIELQQMEVMRKTVQSYGRNHLYSLRSIDTLAIIWTKQGLWAMATSLSRHVINASRDILDKEDREFVEYLGRLAAIYEKVWERKKSLVAITGKRRTYDGTVHREMLEICIKIFGWDHSHTLRCAVWLAVFLFDQARFKEAEELEARVRGIRTRLLGAKHPDTLQVKMNLALSVRRQGRVREAWALAGAGLQRRSLTIRLGAQLSLFLGLHY